MRSNRASDAVPGGTASVQVAFLTGQSRPPCCALSPVQRAFLDRLSEATGTHGVGLNFPYRDCGDRWRPTPLLLASVRNGWHYLRSVRTTERLSVGTLLEQAEHTVFLAGSCGLEFLAATERSGTVSGQCSFVAYGPVARSRPACNGLLVRGRRDWVSGWCGLQPDRMVDCNHLGYLEDETFFQICVGFVREQVNRRIQREHAAAL